MRGKTLLLLGICLGVLLLGGLLAALGPQQMWKLWQIPVMPLSFADVRTITGGAETYRMGLDPLVVNPGDPWGRIMNYPRVWQWLHFAGVDSGSSVCFGVGLAVLFVLGILLHTPPALDKPTSLALLAGIFSPAVLLGIERGNTDLLMYFLLSVAIYSLDRDRWQGRTVAIVAMLAAFVLKLFPIFGFTVLLRERRRIFLLLSLLVVVLALLYTALTLADLERILRGTPVGVVWSYGMDVLWLSLADYSPVLGRMARNLAHVLALLGLALAAQGLRSPHRQVEADQRSFDGFRVGAAVYVGTYLLGSNWDYRLMFLLLAIPQLMTWARVGHGRQSATALGVMLATGIATWSFVIHNALTGLRGGALAALLLDALAHWVMYLGLAYLLAWSSPGWLKRLAAAPWGQRAAAP